MDRPRILTTALNAPPERARGEAASGRVHRLQFGQCHGVIRLPDQREVWFHRSDMCEPSTFNDLGIGDAVTFDFLEDRVSGGRALRVRRT